TVSGGNAVQVFNVASGASLSLEGLTVANGVEIDGGGIFNAGMLAITNSTLSGNSTLFGPFGSDFAGRGVYNSWTLTVTNTTFSGNGTPFQGGGIYNYAGGNLSLTNSTFSGNSASDGGGGICNVGMLTVAFSTLSGNSTEPSDATGRGGGIATGGVACF